ncbi:MAG: VTT domain-containing protein [Acidobacteriia bacterium]|nr:VTT domain-containing protein [Terriglobia bacterium]
MHAPLEFLLKHGYWVLGGWVLLEQLGMPIPALPVLLAMGALTADPPYSFSQALAVVLFSALAADCAWYAIGRIKGHSVLKLVCRISIEPDSCVSSTRYWFKRLGAWALVVAKFVPGLSTIATPMSGFSRMPLWKFVSADAAGTLIWGGSIMAIGFAFRAQLEDVGELAARLGGWLSVLIGAAVALWIGAKYWQRRRFLRKLRVARITPEEVMARMEEVVIVDLRSSTELEFDGMKLPGALWFDRKELALHREKIPRDRDVILYCT